MSADTLINKFRPETFDEVIGHEPIVKALKLALGKKNVQTFLFTGPAGTGKTTLARIVATEAGCKPEDLLEIDAATNTGIEDMRSVMDGLTYQPLGGGAVKAVIVDECHALSKQAMSSLLKILEEPPSWVYWFLCTTETGKVLTTIKQRAMHCDLKPVPSKVLLEHLDAIAAQENILKKGSLRDDIVGLCADEAYGSVRQAISNLAICMGADTYEEAETLLQGAGAGPAEAIDLARALLKGEGWGTIQGIIGKLKETNPETVRHVVRAYMMQVVLNSKNHNDIAKALSIMDAFSVMFDKLPALVFACGKVYYENEE